MVSSREEDGEKTEFEEEELRPRVYTVSALTRLVKSILEEEVGEVRVLGEVSNLRIPASGHAYFSLKDDKSQMRAVLWRGSRARLKFDIKDGVEVLAFGTVSVYPPRAQGPGGAAARLRAVEGEAPQGRALRP